MIPRWLLILVALLGLVGLAAVGAVGYSAAQELSRQQSDLAAAQAKLQSSKTALSAVQASVADASATRQQLAARLADLTATFEGQNACVDARRADFGELNRISQRLTDTWNLTSEDSEFAKAAKVRGDALDDALNAYFQAALKRSQGQTASANTWLAKASSFEKKAEGKKGFMDGILADVNDATAAIKADLDALQSHLDGTASTCAKTS